MKASVYSMEPSPRESDSHLTAAAIDAGTVGGRPGAAEHRAAPHTLLSYALDVFIYVMYVNENIAIGICLTYRTAMPTTWTAEVIKVRCACTPADACRPRADRRRRHNNKGGVFLSISLHSDFTIHVQRAVALMREATVNFEVGPVARQIRRRVVTVLPPLYRWGNINKAAGIFVCKVLVFNPNLAFNFDPDLDLDSDSGTALDSNPSTTPNSNSSIVHVMRI
ncbi:hypothetical protein EVAR_45531_1 [Eumeta japonica]|uniref:Uncharacterized protein n=1 Tax=Eumeta variegata TaxID=151549 RepID=A0A4C1X6E8_EUMVA|nr:hypothetical protein EVAR_45531_1 [Eumeta japonica]